MKWLEVVAGVIWRHERFLGSQRIRGGHTGFWEFPGGKIDPGESRLDALTRELREELGIVPMQTTLWRSVEHQYADRHVHLHVFHVTDFTGEPYSVEGQPVRWLSVEEAQTLRFLEADLPLVAELTPPAVCWIEQPVAAMA